MATDSKAKPCVAKLNESCAEALKTGNWSALESQSVLLNPSSRIQRNLAEKYRRDKMNTYIMELSKIVPTVYLSSKKPDKTSVLRLAANYLRIHHGLNLGTRRTENWPEQADVERILSGLDTFLLVITSSGRIVYVSESVEKMLGFSQVDLMGRSFFNDLVHAEDRDAVANLTKKTEDAGECSRAATCRIAERGLSKSRPGYISVIISGHLRRVARAKHSSGGSTASASPPPPSSSTSSPSWDDTASPGSRRVPDDGDTSPKPSCSSSSSADRADDASGRSGVAGRAGKTTRNNSSSSSIGGNSGDTSSDAEQDGDGSTSPAATNSTSTSISTLTTTSTSSRPTRRRGYSWIFVGVVTPSRIPTTLLQLSMVQAVQDEYVMRNNIEGKIVSVDHRISYLTGFSVSEVRGHNAFAFIHEDDRERIAQEYLRMLYKSEDGTGHVIYRLKTKSSQVVYLRTRGFLEFNRSTQRVESYVCINTLITEDEAMKLDETYRTNQRKLIKDCIVPGGNHASTSSSVKCLPALPDAAKSSTATSTTTFPDSDNDSSKCLNNNDDYSRNKNLDEANASEDRHRNQVSSPRILNISRNRENSLSSASSLFLAQKIFDRPELGLIKYADEDGEEIMAPVSILAPDQRRHLKLAGCAPVRAESLVSSTVSTPDDIDVVPDSNGRSSTPDLDECLFRIETPVPFPEPSPFSEAMLYSGLDVTPERTMTTTSSLTCWYDDGPVNTPQCTPVIDGSVELDGATRAKRVKLDGAVHAWTRQTANS